jgi:beta-N-acetylhexosaminidase
VNTDVATQRIDISKKELRKVDERPYHRYVASHGPLVMVNLAIYPKIDPKPAAFSHKIATGELRKRLGFKGVSVTDSLEAASAQAVGGPSKLARLGVKGGDDLLLYSSLGDALAGSKALTKSLRKHSLPRHAFRASVARVLELRSSLRG